MSVAAAVSVDAVASFLPAMVWAESEIFYPISRPRHVKARHILGTVMIGEAFHDGC